VTPAGCYQPDAVVLGNKERIYPENEKIIRYKQRKQAEGLLQWWTEAKKKIIKNIKAGEEPKGKIMEQRETK